MPTLQDIRDGGKPAAARALSLLEARKTGSGLEQLLDEAAQSPTARVLGLTGPPGVGKSTLTNALVQQARDRGERVAVIAVDPSSLRTRGALLGDRTRIRTNPDDQDVFIRSLAARDRLGGLSHHAIAATVLMRALYDLVIVESVGIGQSEADIALVADTVVLCIQPGSGDSLQFMKAGVMELPDIIAVTKADVGAAARRAQADVEGALGLYEGNDTGWQVPVLLLSAEHHEGLDLLQNALNSHWAFLGGHGRKASRLDEYRRGQAYAWIADHVRVRHGTYGLERAAEILAQSDPDRPFQAMAAVDLIL